jgi:hypothetical protein
MFGLLGLNADGTCLFFPAPSSRPSSIPATDALVTTWNVLNGNETHAGDDWQASIHPKDQTER